jgi:hypothetical protein
VYLLCSEHRAEIQGEGTIDIDHKHEVEFESWFRNRICGRNAINVSKELYSLACGPDPQVAFFKGCIVNGVRFQTEDREETRRTQNSGISVPGEHELTNIDYYGELKNILELRYMGGNRIYLFECNWWNIGNRLGMQNDEHFTSVNTSRIWYEFDPFILACQASQVFYLNDPKFGSSWKVVQNISHRNIYDIPIVVEGESEEDDQDHGDMVYQENECVRDNAPIQQEIDEDLTLLCRDDVPAVELSRAELKALIDVDEVNVELDGSTFITDDLATEECDTNSIDEDEISSNDEITSNAEDESPSKDETYSDNDEKSPSSVC